MGYYGTFNCFLVNAVIVYTVIYGFVLPGIQLPVFQVVESRPPLPYLVAISVCFHYHDVHYYQLGNQTISCQSNSRISE